MMAPEMRAYYASREDLQAKLAFVLQAPRDGGRVEMLVRRPGIGVREVLDAVTLDLVVGVVGDTWKDRCSSRTPDRSPHPDMQVTIMSARVAALIAGDRERWPLAGDQLFVDLDLTAANLPCGTHLSVGTAVLEITSQPHTGCGKFVERFGMDAMKFVGSRDGRALNLRGIYARVVQGGDVQVGDRAVKLQQQAP